MQTLILEGKIIAKTPISHNGGEKNGNVVLFRRQGVIQPNGESIDVPIVSGNAMRGALRDVSAKYTLNLLGENDKPHAVELPIFQLLFSGGALTQGSTEGDVDKYRNIRENLAHVSLFGGAWGNAILQGKMKMNPLIPISQETACIIPEKYHFENMPSIYTYVELNMNTTKEDSINPNNQQYIERKKGEVFNSRQMIYYAEQLKAGTPFYWKVVLEDVTPEEFDFFVSMLNQFKQVPTIGGKSRIGDGQIDIIADEWIDITKCGEVVTVENGTTESIYEKKVTANKEGIRKFLKTI